MNQLLSKRVLRAETLVAIGTIILAAAFLWPTADLSSLSALLPAAMLISLLALAVIMLVVDQQKAAAGAQAQAVTKAPKRVMSALALILLYTLSVDFVGFYISTAVFVPLVAYAFGYRSSVGLAIATVVVLASIYLLFGVVMSQGFPSGRFWQE